MTLEETMQAIFDELPSRLSIVPILRDAHARIEAAVAADHPARGDVVKHRLADVLQEMTAFMVNEYTRRTGQPFVWHDEPAFELTEDNTVMSFHIDANGVVGFGDAPPAAAPATPKDAP